MNLENCRKLLKRVGMLSIIISILGLISGIGVFVLVKVIVPQMPEIEADPLYQDAASRIGLLLFYTIVVNLVSILASFSLSHMQLY